MDLFKKKIIEFLKHVLMIRYYILKFKNRNKPKVLVYTDSRGFDVVGTFGNFYWNSYIEGLINLFNIDFKICPEKHTTILDFLDYVKGINTTEYKYIILHCGIVDFSPRPISNISKVYQYKDSPTFFSLRNEMNDYYSNPSPILYNGEKTINLYSLSFLKENIVPQLKVIDNLVWINSNHFVKGWDGNYPNGRPSNIQDFVTMFDEELMKNLRYIDLKGWSDEDIKKYTIDNIHFTNEGFKKIYTLIKLKLR